MTAPTVLISGASIAGPALAYWLDRYGYTVTLVEKATEIRPGGQAVDFKGETHLTVLRRMGILDEVRSAHVASDDGIIVNGAGCKIGVVPGVFAGGDINIPRGDLSRILYDRTRTTCEYLFGDTITALTETPDGVDVSFAHTAPRTFDLVVGADGIHSNTRRLAFGPEHDYVTNLGYYYAQVGLDVGDADEMYNEPGRMLAFGGSKAPAFFVFASEPLDYRRDDLDRQKQLLTDAFRGGGWRIPEVLDQIPAADEFWMDSISRVTVDRYATGRIALVGDAAYGNALGGFGTGLSIVGAYVLAGELLRADGDHAVAYSRYETAFRKYASVSEKVNAGRLLAPSTRIGIRARNALFSIAFLFAPFMKLLDRFATDIELEDYPSMLSPANPMTVAPPLR